MAAHTRLGSMMAVFPFDFFLGDYCRNDDASSNSISRPRLKWRHVLGSVLLTHVGGDDIPRRTWLQLYSETVPPHGQP